MRKSGGRTKLARARSTQAALKYQWMDAGSPVVKRSDNCRIAVIGVGGAGNSTVTRLMEAGTSCVECVAVNTDALHLNASKAHRKVLIGDKIAGRLGVGGDPRLGRAAAEESRKRLEDLISGVDVVFVTAGLGGGTGTGAAPVVAEIARKSEALVVGVVTTPFRVEKGRNEYAAAALDEMRRHCHTLIVVDNNKLAQFVPQLPVSEAFKVADQILANMIKDIAETLSTPSLINLDLDEFKTIVNKGGMAVVGVGESDAPNRAEEAVRNALRTPLFDVDCAGATGAVIHVIGDRQMTVEEANRIGEIVTETMDSSAHVIWGARVNPEQTGRLKVTLVMTGVSSPRVLSGLGAFAPRLFNLEPYAAPERPLEVDLQLYQMESSY